MSQVANDIPHDAVIAQELRIAQFRDTSNAGTQDCTRQLHKVQSRCNCTVVLPLCQTRSRTTCCLTGSGAARREVLSRLLALNHQRYEEEVKAGLHDKKGGKGKRGKKDEAEGQMRWV